MIRKFYSADDMEVTLKTVSLICPVCSDFTRRTTRLKNRFP